MRRPRDFDTELKALDERARQLRARKVQQLGELVIAARADMLSIEQLAGALIAATEAPSAVKEDWRGRGALFFRTRARDDTRAWVVTRRARTRQLIELGGLIAKAGLIELTDDDRAVIFGAVIECAARLQGEGREQLLSLWRRRGKRAFEAAKAK